MSVRTISSISEYVEFICEESSKISGKLLLKDMELLFRGQSNKDYKLIPAIGRNRSSSCNCTIFNDERNLIEMAKFRLPDVFRNDMLPIELLALLQHHGIPTRLLDITENPLVALYFACNKDENEDGEVIVFKNKNSDVGNAPVVNAIADSYRFSRGTWNHLSLFYGDVKKQTYFLEQSQGLDIIFESDVAGGEWIVKCCEKILYIYAPIRTMRQQIQQGRYILFPNHIDYKVYNEAAFEWIIDEIPKDHTDIVLRVIIPKELKKQILKDLGLLGIKEGFLFPDNIDIACKDIFEMFSNRYKI